jgi:hypothetical protein
MGGLPTLGRQQELAEDVRSLARFLAILVAEASHLGLPTPDPSCLACLQAWEEQLRADADAHHEQGGHPRAAALDR